MASTCTAAVPVIAEFPDAAAAPAIDAVWPMLAAGAMRLVSSGIEDQVDARSPPGWSGGCFTSATSRLVQVTGKLPCQYW